MGAEHAFECTIDAAERSIRILESTGTATANVLRTASPTSEHSAGTISATNPIYAAGTVSATHDAAATRNSKANGPNATTAQSDVCAATTTTTAPDGTTASNRSSSSADYDTTRAGADRGQNNK